MIAEAVEIVEHASAAPEPDSGMAARVLVEVDTGAGQENMALELVAAFAEEDMGLRAGGVDCQLGEAVRSEIGA